VEDNELFDGYEFKVGKGVTAYDEGADVGYVTTGYMIKTAKIAAEKLRKQGIGVRIDHHPSLKPFDRDLLYDMAGKVSCIVTLENHCISGGLHSLVAETLVAKGIGLPVGAIGTDPDDYIHTGHVNDLLYRYKMTSDDVVEKTLETLRIRTGK
jgi:transketolase